MPTSDQANPLLPSSYDLLWSSVAVAAVALAVTALVQIMRTRSLTTSDAVVWILAVVLLPVAGALLWFLVGRPKRTATLPDA